MGAMHHSARLAGVIPGIPVATDQLGDIGLRRFQQLFADDFSFFPRLGSLQALLDQLMVTGLLRYVLLYTSLFDWRQAAVVLFAATSTSRLARSQRSVLLAAFVTALTPQRAGAPTVTPDAAKFCGPTPWYG